MRREYLNADWLGDTARQITYTCVDLLAKQYRVALGARPTQARPFPPPLGRYSGSFRQQYGIPYFYKIEAKLKANEVIDKLDIDPY